MNVVGIIAEYNPFHNGHLYQIQYARETLHADYIVVVMSGDFTQRGTPAITDKYLRSKMALSQGVDLLIELPTIWATSSAELFAKAAVTALAKTGVVNTLLFGAECDDMNLFYQTARLLNDESLSYKNKLTHALSNGETFARARAIALGDNIPADFLTTPNNILGIEYVRAIEKYHYAITPVALRRIGNGYHDTEINHDTIYPSASAIREHLQDDAMVITRLQGLSAISTNQLTEYLDKHCLINPQDISLLLHQRLIAQDCYEQYSDCSKELSNKILNCRDQYVGFEAFIQLLKSRNYTYTRISRMLCHILLNITTDDITNGIKNGWIPYLRILGFSENGSSLLTLITQKSSVSVILQVKTANDLLFEEDLAILQKDLYASDLYRSLLTAKTGRSYSTEYTRKFSLGKVPYLL